MIAYKDYESAIKNCITNSYFSIVYFSETDWTQKSHGYNCCELYYLYSESDESNPFGAAIFISPDYLRQLSTARTDLSACFNGGSAVCEFNLALSRNEKRRFFNLCRKITDAAGYGADIIEKTALTAILLMLNQKWTGQPRPRADRSRNHTVNIITGYIDAHITEKLTIQMLAERFFISSSYICRIFKTETGTTVNQYLSERRIEIAKALLADGANVTDVCAESGFQDYANFMRSFKRSTGMSPKKYAGAAKKKE